MKRILIIFLAAAMCFGLFGCGEKENEPELESVILRHSLEMAELTGVLADHFELMYSGEDMLQIAKSFVSLAEKEPDKAWIGEVGSIEAAYHISVGNWLGNKYLACAGTLNHDTLVQMPQELEDTCGVMLRYRDGAREAYALVVYDPLEEEATTVTAYAVFPEIAEELIDRYFDDAESYDRDEIQALCREAEDVSLAARPSREEASEGYYREKALKVMETVATSRTKPDLYTSSAEVLGYCELWKEVAGTEPTDVDVWTVEDFSDIPEMTGVSDPRMEGYMKHALGGSITMRFSNAYDSMVVASNAVTAKIAKTVCLGPAPKEQEGPVLVVLSYGEKATALVCIYDSGYGLEQYRFAFIPGELKEDLENEGFRKI